MSWAAFEIYDNLPRFAESWSAWPARLEPQQSKASQTSHITINAQGCIYCYTTTQKPLRRLAVFYGDLRSHFCGTRKLGVNKSYLITLRDCLLESILNHDYRIGHVECWKLMQCASCGDRKQTANVARRFESATNTAITGNKSSGGRGHASLIRGEIIGREVYGEYRDIGTICNIIRFIICQYIVIVQCR
jgi:hypothetical protein